MKFGILALTCLFVIPLVHGQHNIELSASPYVQLIKGSNDPGSFRLELSSDIDSSWNKWDQKAYHFGFNPKITPMYTNINGVLSTPYMINRVSKGL